MEYPQVKWFATLSDNSCRHQPILDCILRRRFEFLEGLGYAANMRFNGLSVHIIPSGNGIHGAPTVPRREIPDHVFPAQDAVRDAAGQGCSANAIGQHRDCVRPFGVAAAPRAAGRSTTTGLPSRRDTGNQDGLGRRSQCLHFRPDHSSLSGSIQPDQPLSAPHSRRRHHHHQGPALRPRRVKRKHQRGVRAIEKSPVIRQFFPFRKVDRPIA